MEGEGLNLKGGRTKFSLELSEIFFCIKYNVSIASI